MATFKVNHGREKYRDDAVYRDLFEYTTSLHKARVEGIIGASVVPAIAPLAMEAVAAAYHKEDGVKLRHSILSFDQQECVQFEDVKQIAKQAMNYYAEDYQIMAAVHEDGEHLHAHFIMNTVNYNDGSKYRGTKADYYGFLQHLNEVLQPYGTHVCPAK